MFLNFSFTKVLLLCLSSQHTGVRYLRLLLDNLDYNIEICGPLVLKQPAFLQKGETTRFGWNISNYVIIR